MLRVRSVTASNLEGHLKKHQILFAGVLLLSSAAISHAELSQEAKDIIAEFNGARNSKTALGVTDGNPLAATSFMARSAYDAYALHPRVSAGPRTEDANWTFDISASGGSFESGRIDGYYASTQLELATRFNDSVALSVIVPLEYRNTEHTDTFIGGLDIGLPIVIIPDRGAGFSWVVTPSIMGTGVGVSVNLAQGGYMFGAGMSSSLAWRANALTLRMANQITYASGQPIAYDDEDAIRQNISQAILKNGFAADYALSKAVSLDGSVSYTNMLKDAYTDGYWTFELGASYYFNNDTGIRVAAQSDYADNFKSYGGTLQFFFSY